MRMRTGVAAAISITVPGCHSLNPIEPAAPTVPHSPAISCLGAFPTPVSERVAGLVIAGVRKPAHIRTFSVDAVKAKSVIAVTHRAFQVGCIDAFGQPAVDRRDQPTGC